MSAHSDLLFQAHGRISNPFVLCTLISRWVRQLIISGNGSRSTAEIVDCALRELLAGVLEFEMHGGERAEKQSAPVAQPRNAASRDVLEVEARRQAG